MCFVLIPKKRNGSKIDDPTRESEEVTELLAEYKDIISDNVPDGLPKVWSISH